MRAPLSDCSGLKHLPLVTAAYGAVPTAKPTESFLFCLLTATAAGEGKRYRAQLQGVFLSPSSSFYLPCYQILFTVSFKLMASLG